MPRLAVIQHYLEYITNITTSMGKLFTPIFALFLILINPQDCSDFKTGTFVIEDESYGGSVLIRTKTHQEEIVEKLGIHSRFDLMWINDCKYALFNGSVIKGEDTLPRGKKTDTVFVEITETTADGYKFKATSNFSDFVSDGVVKRKK